LEFNLILFLKDKKMHSQFEALFKGSVPMAIEKMYKIRVNTPN
jgi:hypothetical protein